MTSKRRKMNDLNQRNNISNSSSASSSAPSTSSSSSSSSSSTLASTSASTSTAAAHVAAAASGINASNANIVLTRSVTHATPSRSPTSLSRIQHSSPINSFSSSTISIATNTNSSNNNQSLNASPSLSNNISNSNNISIQATSSSTSSSVSLHHSHHTPLHHHHHQHQPHHHQHHHPHSHSSNSKLTPQTSSLSSSQPSSSSSTNSKPIQTALNLLEQVEEALSYHDNEIFKTDHANNLLKRLSLMRDDESLCDYEIRVNGQSFYCHKFLIIAVSDFFKAMLTGSMKESRENYVDLKGFSSPNGIKFILDFIYTGLLNLSFDNILSILDAASRLQIKEVLKLCADFLIKNSNILNCVYILKLADTYSLKPVVDFTQQYLSENIVEIYQNGGDQFNQLTYEQLKYLLSNECLQVGSELDLFLMIVKWIEAPIHNNYLETTSMSDSTSMSSPSSPIDAGGCSNSNSSSSSSCSGGSGSDLCKLTSSRVKYAAELMKSIRFMCMSAEELADYVERVEFMRTIPECNNYLMDAYRWHALPKRQPLIKSEQTKLRNQEMLVAVGETNIFVLNEPKQKWEVVHSAPLEENYPYPFSVITINNYLYVLGTRRSASEEYKTCYRFSPRTLEWTPLAPLLHDRSRFGCAFISNYIYIFGGFEGFKRSNRVYLNSIERYSIEDDRWEEFSHEGPILSCMASCSYENIIYFGGGKNVNWSKVSDFFSIDVENKQIIKKANMLTARTTHQIAAINGLIYVLGGFDDAGNGILSIEAYDIKRDQWSVITSVPGTISKTWPQSLGILNGRFYISVFTTPNTFKIMQKGYYYDLVSNLWSEAPVINERARYCPTCCLAFPRKICNFKDNCVSINHESSYRSTTTGTNTLGTSDYLASLDPTTYLNEFNKRLNNNDSLSSTASLIEPTSSSSLLVSASTSSTVDSSSTTSSSSSSSSSSTSTSLNSIESLKKSQSEEDLSTTHSIVVRSDASLESSQL